MRRVVMTVTITVILTGMASLQSASAYPVAQALSLTELIKQSDLIAKVVATTSEVVFVSPYKPVHGFDVRCTKLKVLESYKGADPGGSISFFHYAPSQNAMAMMYMPQNYQFEKGKAYILFAKKSDREGVYQQLWENHRSKEDQGLVRAADDTRYGKRPVREVLWRELTKSLKSKVREETIYAIGQLDRMSGGGYDNLKHFDRSATLQTLAPLLQSPDDEIATLVIRAIASRNPYLSPDVAPGWLATIGQGHLPGFAEWEETAKGAAAEFWVPLAEIVESDRSPSIRALAIRALGRTRVPELEPHLAGWIRDPDPLVCQAAAVLLADFPDLADAATLKRLARDPRSGVRIGAAQAIGFGQYAQHVKLLGELLKDQQPQVVSAAAMNLLSFRTDTVKPILEANLEHPQYRCLFINALARDNPADYQDELCEVIEKDLTPENWWGGRIPWGVSWNILFKYVQSQPAKQLKAGRFDKALQALESPEYYSSSEPRDLYALYLQRGLKDRAKKFRENCRQRITYDIDYYFDMVDKNPHTYTRN